MLLKTTKSIFVNVISNNETVNVTNNNCSGQFLFGGKLRHLILIAPSFVLANGATAARYFVNICFRILSTFLLNFLVAYTRIFLVDLIMLEKETNIHIIICI